MRYYVPTPTIDPTEMTESAYFHAIGRAVRALVDVSRGRALVLCTAYKQIAPIEDALRGVPYPVLVGDQQAGSLAEPFRNDRHSILIGTNRYWEGLDVPGDSCSLVVIVRLPFDRVDPLLRARKRAAEARGLNGFRDVALPQAILWLRQGVGRLIRSESDSGVVAILDGRLLTKHYGRVFRDALPPAPTLRSIDEVRAFFARTPA
jgi:ATP-dependent DNA helicase DinG